MQHLDDGYLQSWLDRDRSGITRAEAAEAEAHIAGCEVCAARLAELEGTSERARSLLAAAGPSGDAAPDFEDVVRRARRRAPSRRVGQGWMAAGWAASLVLATGLGWLTHDLLRSGGSAGDRAPAAETAESVVAADLPPVDAEPRVEAARQAAEAGVDAPPTADASATDVAREEVGATEQAAAGTEEARAAIEQARAAAPPLDSVGADPEILIAPTTFADAPAPAGDPGPLLVQGRVRGLDGRPLASAHVTIPGSPIGTMTDGDGTFTLSLPTGVLATGPDRPVALTAQLLGYRSATREIDPGAADSVSVDFLLEQRAVALEEVVVTGAAARASGAAAFRARQGAVPPDEAREVWVPMARAEAEAAAGFALLTVPELAVVEIELGEIGRVAAVRVRQTLDSGATLTLVQQAASAPEVEPTLPEGQPVVTVQVGELRVTGSAPVPVDSLRSLLDAVR